MKNALEARIRDRVSLEWLTPSQRRVWDEIHRFGGPPYHVVNIYGAEGGGKTFLGWLMEREGYATYGDWTDRPQPILPRLALDNAATDRLAAREARPLVSHLNVVQVILISRARVDEPGMPAFELRVTDDDFAVFRANLFRHLRVTLPEGAYRDFRSALEMIG
jgi:hypothetical protein